MNPVIITAIARHILSAVGGMLLLKGVASEEEVEAVAGAGAALAAAVWSIWQKRRKPGPGT